MTYLERGKEHQLKRKAKTKINNLIKQHKLLPIYFFKCVYCKDEAEHFHHPNYDDPYLVYPMCWNCHQSEHYKSKTK